MYLGVSVFAVGNLAPAKGGGLCLPFSGRPPPPTPFWKNYENFGRSIKNVAGFPNGKGPILGKINYLGELFKNYLRGP